MGFTVFFNPYFIVIKIIFKIIDRNTSKIIKSILIFLSSDKFYSSLSFVNILVIIINNKMSLLLLNT